MECMASISKRIPIDVDADTVWAAISDVGNAHRLFAPPTSGCEGGNVRELFHLAGDELS